MQATCHDNAAGNAGPINTKPDHQAISEVACTTGIVAVLNQNLVLHEAVPSVVILALEEPVWKWDTRRRLWRVNAAKELRSRLPNNAITGHYFGEIDARD